MSETSSRIEALHKWASRSSALALVGAIVIDRAKAFGVDIQTDIPVAKRFVEHAGNLVLSGALAYPGVLAMRAIDKRRGGIPTTQRLVGVGALGLALGAGFNAIPDTQIGMDNVGQYLYHCNNDDPTKDGPYCTVDTGDFVWGTLGTGAVAISMTEWRRRENEQGARLAKQSQITSAEPPLPQ